MKNVFEQTSTKFGGFYFIKMNLIQTAFCRQANQNICGDLYIADIQKVKYRPIISVDRYIYRSASSLHGMSKKHIDLFGRSAFIQPIRII